LTTLTNFNPDDYSKLVDRWLKAEKEGELYPVEFDLAWKIAGYSRKDVAKRKLTGSNMLVKGRDYIVIDGGAVIGSSGRSVRGRSPDTIMLTTECFFALCLIAQTQNPIRSAVLHLLTNGKIQFGSDFSDSDRSGFVYLVRASKTSFYKIGCSKKPYQRLQSLQTGSPLEIKIIERIFSFDCQGLEKDLHDYYSAYWLRGEWFDFPEEVVREFVSTANDLDKTREETLPLIDRDYEYETI
jgi:hypothetical protein